MSGRPALFSDGEYSTSSESQDEDRELSPSFSTNIDSTSQHQALGEQAELSQSLINLDVKEKLEQYLNAAKEAVAQNSRSQRFVSYSLVKNF